MSEVLDATQIETYRADGYLVLESRVPMAIVEQIRAEIARFTDMARGMTASDDRLDLEDSHRPDAPRVRRVKLPHTQSSVVDALMRSDHVLAPVRDLIGPDLRLQTTKLNMKSAGFGAAVEWHQDWAFYPYTNDDVLAVGLIIDDMTPENGPLMVFPGSHRGPVYDHHHNGGLRRRDGSGRRRTGPCRCGAADGAGGFDLDPPRPHRPRLGAEPLDPRSAHPVLRDDGRRCLPGDGPVAVSGLAGRIRRPDAVRPLDAGAADDRRADPRAAAEARHHRIDLRNPEGDGKALVRGGQAMTMQAETRARLQAVSVATLATALYRRGLRNQVIQDVRPLAPKGRNMVGPAFTLRYMPAREDRNQLSEFLNPRHPQRVAIETCPAGHVLVMDSRKDARAASAGDILITRLMVRGAAGVVTDGGFRDAAAISGLAIPAYHQRPASPTNLTLHEAIEIDGPIGCGDVAVFPGDVLVGDDDSVIVIPAHLADEIAVEAAEMTAYEDFVLSRVKAGETIIGLYPRTRDDLLPAFADWRMKNGR